MKLNNIRSNDWRQETLNAINVFTGEVKFANCEGELISHAIGSCIVVTVYDVMNTNGAMAHIMLPGKAPDKKVDVEMRYAENAINEILRLIDYSSERAEEFKFCMVGGGNVLKREDNQICIKNIKSVEQNFNQRGIEVSARALGGTHRRSVRFDVSKGRVYYTEDDSKEMLLWSKDD